MRREFWTVVTSAEESSLGLIEKCCSLARERELMHCTLLLSEASAEELARLRHSGTEKLIRICAPVEDMNCESVLANRLGLLIRERDPEAVIFEYSLLAANIAPRIAVKLDRGLTADCTELKWDDASGLLQIRPTFGGRKTAVNRSVARPYMATVRRGVFPYSNRGTQNSVEYEELSLPNRDGQFTVESVLAVLSSGQSLSASRMVFSGGLGLGNRENYEKMCRLAELCGASAGASRAAVAAGYAQYNRQVGQTGSSVSPDLYVAFGISGAVQHLSGIMGAKCIAAVNIDPKAPIRDFCDVFILADANAVIDSLIQSFETADGEA